jgi:exosortase E/protease (VPEID-CTERM system)
VASFGLVALLVLEVVYLTITFDSRPLDDATSAWLRLVARSPHYLRAAITIGVVLLLLRRRWAPAPVVEVGWSGWRRWAWLALHGGGFAGFLEVSRVVFNADPAMLDPGAWVIAWFALAAVTIVSWACAFAPGRVGALVGRRGRVLTVSAVALGTAAWWSGVLTEALWGPLARATFQVVAMMLAAIYPEVVSRPDRLIVGTSAFKVHIADSCSGYEGIGLVVVFLSIYLWLFRRELRFPGALLLLPLGAAAIWSVNAVRIAALIVIGTSGWPAIALGGFHSQAGWIAFNLVALGIVTLLNRSRLFKVEQQVAAAVPAGDSTTAYLAPLLTVMGCAMVTGAFSTGIDWLYPLRVIAAGVVLWVFRAQYLRLGWSLSWRAVAIGCVTFAVWISLVPPGPADADAWPSALASVPVHWAAAWLLLRVVGYTLTVPLVEELAFRGYLMRRLLREDFERLPIGLFSWSSFLVSSVLFGALHGGFWMAGTIAGMTFALALYQRRALGDAVVAHATTNGLIAVYVLATGRWSVWS